MTMEVREIVDFFKIIIILGLFIWFFLKPRGSIFRDKD